MNQRTFGYEPNEIGQASPHRNSKNLNILLQATYLSSLWCQWLSDFTVTNTFGNRLTGRFLKPVRWRQAYHAFRIVTKLAEPYSLISKRGPETTGWDARFFILLCTVLLCTCYCLRSNFSSPHPPDGKPLPSSLLDDVPLPFYHRSIGWATILLYCDCSPHRVTSSELLATIYYSAVNRYILSELRKVSSPITFFKIGGPSRTRTYTRRIMSTLLHL